MKIDLEEECDPPSYTAGQRKLRLKQASPRVRHSDSGPSRRFLDLVSRSDFRLSSLVTKVTLVLCPRGSQGEVDRWVVGAGLGPRGPAPRAEGPRLPRVFPCCPGQAPPCSGPRC